MSLSSFSSLMLPRRVDHHRRSMIPKSVAGIRDPGPGGVRPTDSSGVGSSTRTVGSPVAASGLVAAGGGMITIFGVVWFGIGVALAGSHPALLSAQFVAQSLIEIALGVAVAFLGYRIRRRPENHQAHGIFAILLAAMSLAFPPVGGFLLGFILSVIGGILAIVWKPEVIVVPEMAPPPLADRPP